MDNPWNEAAPEAQEKEAMSLIDKVRRYSDLEKEKKRLKNELEAVGSEMEGLSRQIVDGYEAEGITKLTINGRTYSIKRTYSGTPADGVPRARVGEALIASGLEDLVKSAYHAQSLNAKINEYADEVASEHPEVEDYWVSVEELEAALPDPLRGLLRLTEVIKIASRKA